MNVAEIIDLVARISFNDDKPSAEDRTRILSYVNVADRKVFKAVAQIGSAFLAKTTSLTLTANAVDLPSDFYKSLRVIDVSNNSILEAKEIEEIEKDDPALTATGTPVNFYIENGQFKVYPAEDIIMKVRYTPTKVTLTDNDDSAQILYPDVHTDTLFLETLYLMFFDERDSRMALEIGTVKEDSKTALNSLINYYTNEARQPLAIAGSDY